MTARPTLLIAMLLLATTARAAGDTTAPGPATTATRVDAAATSSAEAPARPQTLYRYTDSAGRPVYSNKPPPAGAQARLLPYTPSPPRRPAPPVMPQAPSAAPPGALQPPPSPGPSQQQVLLEQLAKQIESLQRARNALKEGEAVRNGDERNYQRYLDRVQGLRDVVTRQEGVVEALQDQLRLLGSASLAD